MKYLVNIVVLVCLIGFLGGCTQNSAVSELNRSVLNEASLNGQMLYDAYKKQQEGIKHDAIAVAKAAISDFCSQLSYKPIVVDSPEGVIVYFIGESENPKDIVLGRHYKVIGEKVIVSTKTCHILSVPNLPPGAQTVAATTSHLLSDYPTEFHVYASLRYNKEIYVATASGHWHVNGNKISKL